MKVEKKHPVTIKIPKPLHRLLRIRAAQDEKTIESVATEALERHLVVAAK